MGWLVIHFWTNRTNADPNTQWNDYKPTHQISIAISIISRFKPQFRQPPFDHILAKCKGGLACNYTRISTGVLTCNLSAGHNCIDNPWIGLVFRLTTDHGRLSHTTDRRIQAGQTRFQDYESITSLRCPIIGNLVNGLIKCAGLLISAEFRMMCA